MQIKLGPRLQQVANFVPAGARLADIGSDHGYLAAWLLQQGKIERAIAGELNREPAERARQTALAAGLQKRMRVREGAGLTVLVPGEVDAIVIAGMGGTTIVEILESNSEVLKTVQRLVLQPNVAGAELRRWLVAHEWLIADEALVIENDIIYEIIVAKPGAMQALSPLQAELGPVLLKERPAHFNARVKSAIDSRQHVATELLRSASKQAANKRQQLLQEIRELSLLLK